MDKAQGMASNTSRLFVTSDGKNVLFTFVLVSSLFLLWTCATA
jgi:hypothetical protein